MSKSCRYKQLIFKLLKHIAHGHLELTTPEGDVVHFSGNESSELVVDAQINDWSFVKDMLIRGDIGFAEAYIEAKWDTKNLDALLTFLVLNYPALKELYKPNWITAKILAFGKWLKTNTKSGSKKNISAHYDLGNEFYQLWLDKTMTYSSAIFGKSRVDDNIDDNVNDNLGGGGKDLLQTAQEAKYQRILDRLGAKAGEHILEIGCGWGGFAEYAAQHGVRVTGITLSVEQFQFAEKRIKKAGLENLADFRIKDYRDLRKKYDHIVSIEMFEAVGKEYWKKYFDILKQCLKPGGKAVIQTITIRDDLYVGYDKSSDFIREYIFPGGMLPSYQIFQDMAESAALKVQDVFNFGKDYAHTLETWHQRFMDKRDIVKKMGYSDSFVRMWRFYLSGCYAVFSTGRTDVMQIELGHKNV